MNVDYEYRLPQIPYNEWERALKNVSIIAFMQGIPIGLKYYNNYVIATSTLNKEYVDPSEIYFSGQADIYYHRVGCEKATGTDYIGYRSIDYVAKNYDESSGETKGYYPHDSSTNSNSELSCYYCLVDRANYKPNITSEWNKRYYNALARERYVNI